MTSLDYQRRLAVEPLTSEAFAPFGQVIETASATDSFLINQGTTQRFHALAAVELCDDPLIDPSGQSAQHTRAIISIFRAQPCDVPFVVNMLEKHPLGSQAFMPLSHEPYLVVVATGRDYVSDVRAFLAQPHQGVNYAAGVWHHPLLALNQVCDFLVVDRQGTGMNCVEAVLEMPLVIQEFSNVRQPID